MAKNPYQMDDYSPDAYADPQGQWGYQVPPGPGEDKPISYDQPPTDGGPKTTEPPASTEPPATQPPPPPAAAQPPTFNMPAPPPQVALRSPQARGQNNSIMDFGGIPQIANQLFNTGSPQIGSQLYHTGQTGQDLYDTGGTTPGYRASQLYDTGGTTPGYNVSQLYKTGGGNTPNTPGGSGSAYQGYQMPNLSGDQQKAYNDAKHAGYSDWIIQQFMANNGGGDDLRRWSSALDQNQDPYFGGKLNAQAFGHAFKNNNTAEQEAFRSGLNSHGAFDSGSGFDVNFKPGETNDQYQARLESFQKDPQAYIQNEVKAGNTSPQFGSAGPSSGGTGAGSGPSQPGLIDSLKGLFPGGLFNQSIVNSRVDNARDALNAQRQSTLKNNNAYLAERGLAGSGPEGSAAQNMDQRLNQNFNSAYNDIYANESQNADQRMMQGLQMATGMTEQQAQLMVDQFRAQSEHDLGFANVDARNRETDANYNLGQGNLNLSQILGMGNLGIQNMNGQNNYNLGLANFGLNRDALQNQIGKDQFDQLIKLLQGLTDQSNISSGGYY
jgi:hypothetical protein